MSSAARTLSVRPATPADYDAVRRLTQQAYLEGGYLEAGDEYLQRIGDAAARDRDGRLWVAELDGVVVGALNVTLTDEPYTDCALDGELEFRMLAVDPAAQGNGVGRALVQAVLDLGRSMPEIHHVVLTSIDTMLTAHRLYLNMGFERVPERDWRVDEHDINLIVFHYPV